MIESRSRDSRMQEIEPTFIISFDRSLMVAWISGTLTRLCMAFITSVLLCRAPATRTTATTYTCILFLSLSFLTIQKKIHTSAIQKEKKPKELIWDDYFLSPAPSLLYDSTHRAGSSSRGWQSSCGLWRRTTLRQLASTELSPLQEPHIRPSGPFWQHLWWTFWLSLAPFEYLKERQIILTMCNSYRIIKLIDTTDRLLVFQFRLFLM